MLKDDQRFSQMSCWRHKISCRTVCRLLQTLTATMQPSTPVKRVETTHWLNIFSKAWPMTWHPPLQHGIDFQLLSFLNTIDPSWKKNMSVGQGGPWVGQIVVALATADVPGKLQHNHQCLWKEWEMVFSTWLLLCHVSWKFALLVVMPAKQTTKHLDASIYEQRRLFGEAKSSYGAYMGIHGHTHFSRERLSAGFFQ